VELRQFPSDDAGFLSWVITADESWIYVYDPETEKQSCQCKSPNSSRPTRAGQMKSKVRNKLSIFYDMQRIVHKELILIGELVTTLAINYQPKHTLRLGF
jgi:hypothetical protein